MDLRTAKNKTLTLTEKEIGIVEDAIYSFWDVGVEDRVAALVEAASSISAIESVLQLAKERQREANENV